MFSSLCVLASNAAYGCDYNRKKQHEMSWQLHKDTIKTGHKNMNKERLETFLCCALAASHSLSLPFVLSHPVRRHIRSDHKADCTQKLVQEVQRVEKTVQCEAFSLRCNIRSDH